MSEVSKDKAFDRAIDLVINQDHIIQQWTGRYITIQGGLAAALAAVLSWKGIDLGFITIPLSVLIGSIAIMLSCKITKIIKREYEWQDTYVKMVKRTEGKDPLLFQDNYEPLPGKKISVHFIQIQKWIILAWVLVIIAISSPFLKLILTFFCQHFVH